MGRREVTGEVLHAFDVSEIDAPPAQVEEALRAVPAETVAFAVWRGAGRPALLCRLRDRAAVSMAMSGVARARSARSTPPCSSRSCSRRCSACSTRPSSPPPTASSMSASSGLATAPVDRGDASAAFLLRAPTVAQVRAVADAGAVMPQKSTYFFPKLYSGFLINPLDA